MPIRFNVTFTILSNLMLQAKFGQLDDEFLQIANMFESI